MRRRIARYVLLLLALPTAAFGAQERFEKAYSLEGVRQVSLENVNGNVDVRAWAKPYVRVTAVKSSRREETVRRTEIRVRLRGDSIRIETVSPRRRHLFGFFRFGDHVAQVRYEIWLPPSIECRAETVNGSVEVSGMSAPVRAGTVNGRVEVDSLDGPLRAETVNGSIHVTSRGNLRSTDLHTVNGAIEVAFPKSSSVRYRLETVNGAIEAAPEMELSVAGKFGPKEARGSWNGGAEKLVAETVNGSIHLRLE